MSSAGESGGQRGLHVTGLPAGADEAFAGGAAFVTYCLGAKTRVKHRREAIKRAQSAHRQAANRGDSPYPTALIYSQRLGVALEDLGRLAIALEAVGTSDAFKALRLASLDDLDAVFDRLRDDETLRRAFKQPGAADVAELKEELREPVLAASTAQTAQWKKQWTSCATGWPLLCRLAKGMRHGSPLVPRETVLTPPGAGSLGEGAEDRYDRWVLVITTDEDHKAKSISTQWTVADISDKTLARAHTAVLDGLALAKDLQEAHVGRVTHGYKWVLSRAIVKKLNTEQRTIIQRHQNG
jgi:hypothetical protein